MKAGKDWQKLGWRHPLWDIVRFYCSLARPSKQAAWLAELEESKRLEVGSVALPIASEHVRLFFAYLKQREKDFASAYELLRSEEEALAFCNRLGIPVAKTQTRT